MSLLCVLVLAFAPQDKPDTSLADLDAAKTTFQEAMAKVKANLVVAFATEEKKVADSTRLKSEERIKQTEQLQEQKLAFEETGKYPNFPGMLNALRDYKRDLTAARAKCEKAFDAAADALVRKKDLDGAKETLVAKARHFEGVPDFDAEAKREFWVYNFPDRKDKDLWYRFDGKGAWTERGGDDVDTPKKFREVKRTAEYIELFDAARQVGSRLYVDRCEMKLRDKEWAKLADGSWQKLTK